MYEYVHANILIFIFPHSPFTILALLFSPSYRIWPQQETTPGDVKGNEVRAITGVHWIPPPWASTPSKQLKICYHPGSVRLPESKKQPSGGTHKSSFRHRTSCRATLKRGRALRHGRLITVDRTRLWPRQSMLPPTRPADLPRATSSTWG